MLLLGLYASCRLVFPSVCPVRATAYTVFVEVLTFKVIQGRWFSFHLKKHMRFFY